MYVLVAKIVGTAEDGEFEGSCIDVDGLSAAVDLTPELVKVDKVELVLKARYR